MQKETIGTAILYCGDCMEGMAVMSDKSFDLAIVDPPYGIGEDGSRNASRGKLAVSKNYKPFYGNDTKPPDDIYFKELERVSRNQIIWGANHFMQNIAQGSPCWIVWDKMTGNSDFADSELAYTSFKTAVRNFRFQWLGMLQGDMKNKELRIHPTQKPVRLYHWLLQNYAKKGQTILDTHLGSGSNVIACLDMGFTITGFEIDPEYFNAACERIEKAYRKQKEGFFNYEQVSKKKFVDEPLIKI